MPRTGWPNRSPRGSGPDCTSPATGRALGGNGSASGSGPPHEFLGEDPVEPLELPTSSRIVRPPVDHRDTSGGAVLPELLRDEATPVVDVESLGLAATLERPPEIVRGLTGPLSEVGAGHHEVPGPIVQDGVDVDMPPDPGD